MFVRVGAWVCVCVCVRSLRDKMLCFKNSLIINYYYYLSPGEGRNLNKRSCEGFADFLAIDF